MSNFKSFDDFYPYYLSQHRNKVCRQLHFSGSLLALLLAIYSLLTQTWLLLLAVPIVGYGCAWVGHFFFEKNKPAAFHHPLYSFMGDWVLFKDILTGKIPFS